MRHTLLDEVTQVPAGILIAQPPLTPQQPVIQQSQPVTRGQAGATQAQAPSCEQRQYQQDISPAVIGQSQTLTH